jgi:hypothetical protein
LAEAMNLAETFAKIVRERQPVHFDALRSKAQQSELLSFRRFAKRLWTDYDAVKAGVISPWSNGQVEGQINKLKMLKRQMYMAALAWTCSNAVFSLPYEQARLRRCSRSQRESCTRKAKRLEWSFT